MLEISNDKCQYLKLNSPTIKDFILNPDKYTKVELEYKINCAENYISSELIHTNETKWYLDAAQNVAVSDILKTIKFKHIITGDIFSAEGLTYDMSTLTSPGGFTTFQGLINDLLIGYGFPAATVTKTGSVIEIDDLPVGIIPFSLEFSTTTEVIYFNYQNQNKFFISSDYLYLRPASFNLVNYLDGVYNVKLIFTLEDGTTIEENQCFFADCTIKCQIASLLEEMLKDDTLNVMIYRYYEALRESGNCGGCNCVEMCELYERIVDYLNSPLISPKINSKDCCSGCN